MSNLIFPALDGLRPNPSRTAIWKTGIKESASGKELRAARMSAPRWRYSLSFDVLRETSGYTELQQIVGLFNQCRGSWDNFLYRDPEDCTVTGQQFGTGDGTRTQFQLVRSWGAFVEPVTALNGTPAIYRAGNLQGSPVNYTISPDAIVSFSSPPGIGEALTWTGNFYWRCRFTRDELEYERFLEDLYEARRVEFITVKGELA